jgi:hypothetical protein
MPPKAQSNVRRGRGRPSKRSAAPEPAPVANAVKRGRVAKVDGAGAPTGTPKKRGRPAKIQDGQPLAVDEPLKRGRRSLAAPEAPVKDAPAPKKRMGRPAKKEITEASAPEPTLKKRAGRPSKADAAVEEAIAIPKPRGRPVKNAAAAVNLSRVAGSPRVSKRSKPIPRATKAAIAPRIDPRVRSKLRTRLPPAVKPTQEVVSQPKKRRGRPPKANAAAAQAPSSNKGAGRKATKAAVAKPSAPRKRRGYMMLEIPDKFVAQVKQYLQELQDAETFPTPVQEETETEAEIEAGAEAEEEDQDMIVEEDPHITSATADDGIGDAFVVAKQVADEEDFAGDQDEDDMQEDMQEETVQDVIVEKDVEDEPTEVATEVDVQMSVQEVVQMEQELNDADALQQELVAIESHNDEPSSSLNDKDMEAFIRDAESRPSSGAIFG